LVNKISINEKGYKWDGWIEMSSLPLRLLVRRSLEGRRLVRWAISPVEEFIAENTDKKAEDFGHEHYARFRHHGTCRHKGFDYMIILSIENK
jgi:hypothetical protein